MRPAVRGEDDEVTGAAGGAWPPGAGVALRQWPLRTTGVVWVVVVVIIGGFRHFDFHGIEGFSTTNWGWVVSSLVGGVGLSVRLAGRPATWQILVRPLLAAAAAFVVCFVMVTIMGLLFLPDQGLTVTLTTDAPGRSVWVAVVVVVLGYVAEGARLIERRLRR